MRVHPLSPALAALALFLAPAAASPWTLGFEGQGLPGHFERRIATRPSVRVEVSTGSGDVRCQAGAAGTVFISATVRVHNSWFFGRRHAQKQLDALQSRPPIRVEGDLIRIGQTEDSWIENGVSISYDITVPADTRLTVHSGSGDILLKNVGGKTEATAGSGSITGSGLSGEVIASTGSGDVAVTFVQPGSARLETGSGDITADGMQGNLEARTGSGDVSVAGLPQRGWRVHTGSGNVTARVQQKAGFELDAHTGSGEIRMQVPILVSGGAGRNSLHGRALGGGALLSLETSSGDITVQSVP